MEADWEFFCSCKLVPEVDLAVDVANQLGPGQGSQGSQGGQGGQGGQWGGDANPGQELGGSCRLGRLAGMSR